TFSEKHAPQPKRRPRLLVVGMQLLPLPNCQRALGVPAVPTQGVGENGNVIIGRLFRGVKGIFALFSRKLLLAFPPKNPEGNTRTADKTQRSRPRFARSRLLLAFKPQAGENAPISFFQSRKAPVVQLTRYGTDADGRHPRNERTAPGRRRGPRALGCLAGPVPGPPAAHGRAAPGPAPARAG